MKLEAKVKDSIMETRESPGILKCEFEHIITNTKVELEYKGPAIPPDLWHQMMSFFRWTYATTKSESQVRIFLDPKERGLIFWAFPQEARTGMTAKEIDSDDAKKQRAALPNSGSLILFGTVHHHCSASAFQSSVDEHNEKNQTGLHITIGCIDKDEHDLHARFYYNGLRFTPDLSEFWDIGDQMVDLCPLEVWNRVAVHQMTRKVEVPFPDEWKTNLIEIKSTSVTTYRGGLGYSEGYGCGYNSGGSYHTHPKGKRTEVEAEKIVAEMMRDKIELSDMMDIGEFLAKCKIVREMCWACNRADIDMDDLIREFNLVVARASRMIVDKTDKGGKKKKKVQDSRDIRPNQTWNEKERRWEKVQEAEVVDNGNNGAVAQIAKRLEKPLSTDTWNQELGEWQDKNGLIVERAQWSQDRKCYVDSAGNPVIV